MMNGKSVFALETSTQIYDNKRLILSRCRRIIEYNDIYIKASAGNIDIEIWGDGLSMDDYCTEGITVYGRIDTVTFTPSRRRERG